MNSSSRSQLILGFSLLVAAASAVYFARKDPSVAAEQTSDSRITVQRATFSTPPTNSRTRTSKPGQPRQSESRIKERLRAILEEPDPLDHEFALVAFRNRLAPEDFPIALDLMKSMAMADIHEGMVLSPDFVGLLEFWTRLAPETAIQYSNGDHRLLSKVAGVWSETDPVGAATWVKYQPEEVKEQLIPHILIELASKDMSMAFELANDLPTASLNRGGKEAALVSIAPELAKLGPGGCQDILDRCDAATRIRLFGTVIGEISPQDYSDWATKYPEDIVAGGIALSLFRRWTCAEPSIAVASLGSLAPGPLRDQAFEGVVGNLEDTEAALSLMSGNPDAITDRALHAWAQRTRQEGFEKLWSKIESINDSSFRERSREALLRKWPDSPQETFR